MKNKKRVEKVLKEKIKTTTGSLRNNEGGGVGGGRNKNR